jgi:O-antigen/teichoic acid export membrane protein
MANALKALKSLITSSWRNNDFVVANSYIFLNSLIIKFQGLLIAFVVTFGFGIAGYGTFQFSLSTAIAIASTISLGLPSVLSVYYASGRQSLQSNITRMRFSYLMLGVVLGSLVLTSLLAFTNLFSIPDHGGIASKTLQISKESLTFALLIWVPLLGCNQISIAALTGLQKFVFLCRLGLIRISAYLAVLGLRACLTFSLLGLLLLFIAIDFLTLVLTLIGGSLIAPVSIGFLSRFTRSLIRKRDFLTIIGKTSLANVGIIIALWALQRYLISTQGGADSNGFYNLILRVSSALSFIPGIFSASIIPVLTRHGIRSSKFRSAFRNGMFGYLVWSIVLLVIFLPLNELITFHFGSFGLLFIHFKWLIYAMVIALILNTYVSNVLLAGGLFQEWIVSDYVLCGVIFFGLTVLSSHNSPIFNVFLEATFAYALSSAYGVLKIRKNLNMTKYVLGESDKGRL